MFNKMLCAIVLGLMSVGCMSAPNGSSTVTVDDILSFTATKLAEVGATANAALNGVAAVDAKLEEARVTVASMEAIVGPVDTDKDGEVSTLEATDFYGRVTTSTNPDAQNPEKQSETYKALMLLLGANMASRKLGHKLPPSLQWVTSIFGSPTKTSKA